MVQHNSKKKNHDQIFLLLCYLTYFVSMPWYLLCVHAMVLAGVMVRAVFGVAPIPACDSKTSCEKSSLYMM